MSEIITNKKVDSTFQGESCLLKRSVVSVFKENNHKRYVILTERCNYRDKEVHVFDDEGNVQLDDQGNKVTQTIQVLEILSQKDRRTDFIRSFGQIDEIYEQIRGLIPEGLTKMQEETLEEQLILLSVTKEAEPWNTVAEDWEIL